MTKLQIRVFPNPVRPEHSEAIFSYTIPDLQLAEKVELEVFNVAGDLVTNEVVKRLVRIESTDYPVAVLDGFSHRVVGPVTCGVRVTGDIQPVSPPAFSVGPGLEEAVGRIPHKPLVEGVAETVDLFRALVDAGKIDARQYIEERS